MCFEMRLCGWNNDKLLSHTRIFDASKAIYTLNYWSMGYDPNTNFFLPIINSCVTWMEHAILCWKWELGFRYRVFDRPTERIPISSLLLALFSVLLLLALLSGVSLSMFMKPPLNAYIGWPWLFLASIKCIFTFQRSHSMTRSTWFTLNFFLMNLSNGGDDRQ